MNKKIKNAQECSLNGITFKSKLERNAFSLLVELGLSPQYEGMTFVLWEGMKPTVPFYTKSKTGYKLNNTKLKDITYTPDFIFDLNGKHIILEIKGFRNDSFPLKLKMFRKLMESWEDKENWEYWEVYSIKQLKSMINEKSI